MPEALPICSAKPFEYIKKFIKDKIKEGVFRDVDILIASSLIMGPVIRIIQLKMEGVIKEDLIRYTDPLFEGISKSIFKNKH